MIPENVRKFTKTIALIKVRINSLPLSSRNEMVSKLKETKITRRAFATTFDPLEDHDNPSPPCLISIQSLVADDNRLHMIAYFRSHDMFKAALPNAYGLLQVQKYIAEQMGIQ